MTRRRWATAVTAVALLAAGCSAHAGSGALGALDALGEPTTTTGRTTTTTTSPAERECNDQHLATKSYRPPDALPPPGSMPAGTYMEQIHQRGTLRVGVDQTTLGFGYRDRDGNLTGFDVSIAKEVAKAIFGTDSVELIPVSSGQRVDAVEQGTVDLVVSLLTMTCSRWQRVLFSTEYFDATQRVLVRNDSTIKTLADLGGKTVCATAGSTSISNIRQQVPTAKPHPVANRADCLVLLQQGAVDAITADDTILHGFMVQDPTTHLLDTGPLEDEPYGIAVSEQHPEFVRFVNGVLAQLRGGTWQQLHGELETKISVPAAAPPSTEYRD